MAETETVAPTKAVKWGPVKKLAQDISELYSSKKIFELKEDLKESDTIISKRSTRSTDPNASVCTISSAEQGCVYLSRDITAPFRIDKLGVSEEPGKPSNFGKKVLAFEFAYHPDKYEEYLNGKAKPVLTTQYLLYYESVSNDITYAQDDVMYSTEHIARELSESPSTINSFDICTITNLIESDRSKIRKFWDYGDNGDSYYADSTEIAGELYMLFEGSSNPDCCYIARVALAGLNNNGNGNSTGADGKPATWVTKGNGYVGAAQIPSKFVTRGEVPWMSSKPYAVTLTGISMDRTYKSDGKEIINSTKGFRPETPGESVGTYPPPPIGCSAEFIWPTIGTEGGGDNSFYKPTEIFSKTYLHWADWRPEYQHELSQRELDDAKNNKATPPKNDDDTHFPCNLGEERTGDDPETYHYLRTDKNVDYPYQRWVKVDDTTYVRMAPMEFNVPSDTTYKAYLAVPLTVVKILKPKSYQPAIRKRWYDMMYYTLRNIAGYKYKKYIDNEECYRVIGVTWDNEKINNTSYTNPCFGDSDDDPSNDDCSCTKCSYERWKVLNLGGRSSADEFVGTEEEFNENSEAGFNAAQMWIWDEDRLTTIDKNKSDMEDYDILFPELYFERLLCYNNKELYSAQDGGFVNPQKENKPCECLICYYTSYQTSPIDLPWEGGGNNKTCESEEKTSEITIYNTHAYTFKVLYYLTEFITEYKLEENAPRDISTLEIGYCYCPATAGNTTGITLTNRTVSYYYCENGEPGCKEATLDLFIPEIPSYYNTLSINEKASLEPNGKECLLEIAKDLKPYGYSAYIWKAVDIGGYKENRKDIKIEFTHYDPARVCSSGTIMGRGVRELCDPNAEDDPLYMYNTSCYTAIPATSPYSTATVTDSPCTLKVSCPNEEGSILAFNYNRGTYMSPNTDQIWEEALYWSNEKWVSDCEKTPNPAAMASAKIWNRDNEDTAIGTIDIYVAPFYNPAYTNSLDRKHTRFIGSCTLQRKPPESELEDPMQHIGDLGPVVHYACGEIPAGALMTSEDQDVSYHAFTVSNPDVIEFDIRHDPTGSKGDPNNYVQVDITIPHTLLIDEKTPDDDTYGLDLRQKYIILAVRASHTKIHSGLATRNGQFTNDTFYYEDDIKPWALTCAGACRYAEFKTAYKFSSVDPSTS